MRFSPIEEYNIAIQNRLKKAIQEWEIPDGIELYLFGSCARGEAKKGSDIDVALVSDRHVDPFEAAPFYDYHLDGHPFPINITEFAKYSLSKPRNKIQENVSKEGIPWQLLVTQIMQ